MPTLSSLQKVVIFTFLLFLSYFIGKDIAQPIIKEQILDVKKEGQKLSYTYRKKPVFINPINLDNSLIKKYEQSNWKEEYKPSKTVEFVVDSQNGKILYKRLELSSSRGVWSLLPAFVALALCIVLQSAIPALFGGVLSGCLVLGSYDVGAVFVKQMGTPGMGKIIFLYLILLGGILGMWQKMGAAEAFAQFMTKRFVKGPRSAKLVAWFLGVVFFQGGTISTVVVGTTVKPITDKENISHEELAYIVDSTASPIASQIPFNAWPFYIQAFIFVPGVAFLATEELRFDFFVSSVIFCFYAILAVTGTFLLSIDKPLFVGKRLREAIKRAKTTGQLDLKHKATYQKEPSLVETKAHFFDFLLCILILIIVIVSTKDAVFSFSIVFLVATILAFIRGLNLTDIIDGLFDGMKSLLPGTIILILAITLGSLSKACGGGEFLTSLILGVGFPYWLLPMILVLITVVISFSTGTSWGTYALAFPIGMPLAWKIAQDNGMDPSEATLFMTICFACIMDGSVFGDQCSPISDTTILTSTCTECDLMEHVRTQIPQASIAMLFAIVMWTTVAFFFC